MKPSDRMTLYEAPRVAHAERAMREIELRFRGRNRHGPARETVQIPQAMSPPDLITYRGHTFVRRDDTHYAEGTMWPILVELDGA